MKISQILTLLLFVSLTPKVFSIEEGETKQAQNQDDVRERMLQEGYQPTKEDLVELQKLQERDQELQAERERNLFTIEEMIEFYNNKDTDLKLYPFIAYFRRKFENEESTISKQEYSQVLLDFFDGTVENGERNTIVDEAQISNGRIVIDSYLNLERRNINKFTFRDVLEDTVTGKMFKFVEKKYPQFLRGEQINGDLIDTETIGINNE